jgi:DNA segregation ATPase FtsK/SpoIIIE-like protein
MRDALRNAITMEEISGGNSKIIIHCATLDDMRKISDHLLEIKFGIEKDRLYDEAVKRVIGEKNRITVALLQRRFDIRHNRAEVLIAELVKNGVVEAAIDELGSYYKVL